jgi:hypothetical protein
MEIDDRNGVIIRIGRRRWYCDTDQPNNLSHYWRLLALSLYAQDSSFFEVRT